MICNSETSDGRPKVTHVAPDSTLPFSDYIDQCRQLIESRRTDLKQGPVDSQTIINANLPFERLPAHHTEPTSFQDGALLLHGLFDCPFSLKEIAQHLQSQDIFCRSLLLPGHGTRPEDLEHITWQDWVKTMQYGIASMKNKVKRVFLVGYSTGAALSTYHALQNEDIAGLILISPAFKLKFPVDIMIQWRQLSDWVARNKPWICQVREIDYAKYKSIPFNAVTQVQCLIEQIKQLQQTGNLKCPIFIIMSQQDETVSANAAVSFFKRMPNEANRFLLYAEKKSTLSDKRIIIRNAHYPELAIKNFSHVCIPFSPSNPHYGQLGDYQNASRHVTEKVIYGAYNQIEMDLSAALNHKGVLTKKYAELTYNPDFDFFVNELTIFIKNV